MGEMRSGEGLSMAVASPFAPAIRALIVSPGKVKGICTLFLADEGHAVALRRHRPDRNDGALLRRRRGSAISGRVGGDERLFIAVLSLFGDGKRSQNCPSRRLY